MLAVCEFNVDMNTPPHFYCDENMTTFPDTNVMQANEEA